MGDEVIPVTTFGDHDDDRHDEDAWEYKAADEGAEPAGYGSATFNMVNSILGAGLVGLPNAFAQAGVPLGWLLFVGTALLTCYTLEILITCGDRACRAGHISAVAYEEITAHALGEKGRRAALAFQWLYTFGACVGYVVILKDSLCTALGNLTGQDFFEDNKTLVTAALCVVLLLPICLLRSVASLSNLSLVSFVAVILIVIMAIYEYAAKKDDLCDNGPPIAYPPAADTSDPPVYCDVDYSTFGRVTAINVLGVFVFAYMAHHNQFPIYRSLGERASPKPFAVLSRSSILLASLLTGVSSAVIYATYGQTLDSDFFKTYPSSNNLVNVGRLVFALTMVLSFPMQFVVGREVLQVVVTDWLQSDALRDTPGPSPRSSASDEAVPVLPYREVPAGGHIQEVGQRQPSRHSVRSGRAVGPEASGLSCSSARNVSFTRSGLPRSRLGSAVDKPPSCAAMSAAGGGVREDTSLKLHLLTTIPLFVIIIMLALAAPSLGSVLNLVGGVMGSSLGFIIPALINIADAKELGTEPVGGKVLAWAVVCFGVCMAIISTVTSVMDFAGQKIEE